MALEFKEDESPFMKRIMQGLCESDVSVKAFILKQR